MPKILVIDDDEDICGSLETAINLMGFPTDHAFDMEDGLRKINSNAYDVVFLDVYLPDGDGLDALPKIRAIPSSPEVIIITGEGHPDGAELAIKNGAWDYIQKPLSVDNIILQLTRSLQYRDEKKAIKPSMALKREGIIGESPEIRKCLDLVVQAALSDVNVLITGDTGTGKELFASAIHENSGRSGKNFVIVDCAALPETLVESTLFGHVKGAFTGAYQDREGLIKQADGGTIFLDEIGELPTSVQKTFLRVLQERRFRPVGSKKEINSDFRLIAATNRDLNELIKDGKFRRDLLFRIKSLIIELPPLKERVQDIKELALQTMIKFCDREGIGTKGFSPEFIKILETYDWPGNVRELINIIEGAISKARYEPTLFPKHLSNQIRINVARSSFKTGPEKKLHPTENPSPSQPFSTLKEFRETVIMENEKRYLRELISFTGGDIKEACRISGLGRARLYGLMKNYGISRAF